MSAGESYGESQGCDVLRVPCTAVGPSRPVDRGMSRVGMLYEVLKTAPACSRYLGASVVARRRKPRVTFESVGESRALRDAYECTQNGLILESDGVTLLT